MKNANVSPFQPIQANGNFALPKAVAPPQAAAAMPVIPGGNIAHVPGGRNEVEQAILSGKYSTSGNGSTITGELAKFLADNNAANLNFTCTVQLTGKGKPARKQEGEETPKYKLGFTVPTDGDDYDTNGVPVDMLLEYVAAKGGKVDFFNVHDEIADELKKPNPTLRIEVGQKIVLRGSALVGADKRVIPFFSFHSFAA